MVLRQIFGDKPTIKKDVKIRLVSYDFGGGYRRVDIEPTGLCIVLNINDKTGEFESYDFVFSFHQIDFGHKLYKFLKEAKKIGKTKDRD